MTRSPSDPAAGCTGANVDRPFFAYSTNCLVDLKKRDHRRCRGEGVEPHIPVFDRSERKDCAYPATGFTCDHEAGQYTRPGGKPLKPYCRNIPNDRPEYGKDGLTPMPEMEGKELQPFPPAQLDAAFQPDQPVDVA
jgi:hypothetical protein